MQCPAGCDATLVMSERQGVEIDYCPTCRGVWLDRGELDKIIERDNAAFEAASTGAPAAPVTTAPPAPAPGAPPPPPAPDVQSYRAPYPGSPRYGKGYGYGDGGYGRRKKKGFLGDLFDFD